MSAFIVDRNHIGYMVAAAMTNCHSRLDGFRWRHGDEWHKLEPYDYERAVQVGRMLWEENIRSVLYRYPEDTRETAPGPKGETYEFRRQDIQRTGLDLANWQAQLAKAVACYEYQSCEHPAWESSEAKAFCDAINAAILRKLPGYEAAEWGAPKAEPRRIAA